MSTTPPPTAAAPRGRWARPLRALLAALALSFAAAQEVCVDELRAAVPEGAAPPRVATAVARTALEAIEPALPADRGPSREWDDPHAHWLQVRGYLPREWEEEGELNPDAWAALLANLQTPYRVEPAAPSGATDPETLVGETAAAVRRVASAVRPLALVATEPGDRSSVAFAAVIWNWTPWPRLLVFHPGELAFGAEGDIEPLLDALGSCAWRPRAWFLTDADTAANYYLGNREARMRLLATDRGSVRELVPQEREREVLTFADPMVEGARVAAIGFEGPGPSVGQVAGLLSSVRTNIGLFDLSYFLAMP